MPLVATYNRTAIQTPTPQSPAQHVYIESCGNPGTAFKNSNLAQGDVGAVIVKFNQNALRSDIISTYGGGGYGILWGLTLSESTGLNATVAAGQANILSLTELPSAYTITVPASSSACYIWLLDSGSLTYQNESLTPPSSASLYLGVLTTNGTGITAIDLSGVPYIKGNHLWRRTADAQAPTDSLPSTMTMVTQTSAWVYEWDGSQHKQRIPPEQIIFKTNGPSFVGGHLTQNYAITSGSGNITLAASSANIQRVLPTATLNLTLPSSGLINPGMSFSIYNDAASGAGFNVKVYDSTSTYLISTVTPKTMVALSVIVNGASSFTWPASATPTIPPL